MPWPSCDDAIVVVENSTRLLDTGRYTSRQAVTEAMGEVTGPIVGVVLVLLAVFIPTTLVSAYQDNCINSLP